MRRWLAIVAIGLLGALIALLVLRPEPALTSAERVDALSAELRCPDCQGLSVADSPTRSAQEIRRQVVELVENGASDDEVRDHFVARYGEWVLLAPRSALLWLVPFGVVLAAAAGLLFWLGRRRSRAIAGAAGAVPATTLSDEERRRLHEDAEALDA